MPLIERVIKLDKQQSDPDRGVLCPKGGAKHGRLVAEGTGLLFMCGPRCGASVPALLKGVED